ncbi:hypothetical protein LQ939_18495 [Pantoea alhagi]|uniref:hypothetical protein n=1 Tax=Pantoea alhagi TaxID=1891675 RepID=UPI00202B266D|nr:hypothetical protein [Pantoea alhagi]URQ60618.1 hypothetical protein LQ939_18495 [Pantoea alhagi]
MGKLIKNMKWLTRTLGLTVVMVIALVLADCKMMGVAEKSPGFKQSDWWLYYSYVDKELKNAPRISDDYYFLYGMMDGPSPEMSAIIFNGATDTAELENYLTALGYRYVPDDEWGGYWEREGRRKTEFYIWQNKEQQIIRLTKYSF